MPTNNKHAKKTIEPPRGRGRPKSLITEPKRPRGRPRKTDPSLSDQLVAHVAHEAVAKATDRKSQLVGRPRTQPWPDDIVRACAELYVVEGDAASVSKLMGGKPSHKTINEWVNQNTGFQSYLSKFRAEFEAKLDAKFSKVLDKATDAMLDRIERGDVRIVKGEQVRVPVKLSDLPFTIGTVFDKRQLGRALPTAIREDSGGNAALAERLVGLLRQSKQAVQGEVVDVVVKAAE